MKKTKIEWTEATWNPSTGCTKVSEGCRNCYAATMARRLQAMGVAGYENGFKFNIRPERLQIPVKTKKPTKYFVNSMSDLFHEKMPEEYLDRVFEVIRDTPEHTYQILTKRAESMAAYFSNRNVPGNAWLGVTVENRQSIYRIDLLRQIEAVVSFISFEPLLEDIGLLNLAGIDWAIVGGESGPCARAMKSQWAASIQKQCSETEVAFFFKQWGTWGVDGIKRSKKANGRYLLGKIWNEQPAILAE